MPFYLRTGKYLKRRWTEIAIRFHQAPYALFRGTHVERMHPNWMILRIQPDEGIALEFAAKRPGPDRDARTTSAWTSPTRTISRRRPTPATKR